MIPDYPRINKYAWSYQNRVEIHVDSYMCNQDIKVMYLGFFIGTVTSHREVRALYK